LSAVRNGSVKPYKHFKFFSKWQSKPYAKRVELPPISFPRANQSVGVCFWTSVAAVINLQYGRMTRHALRGGLLTIVID
jgi:hypothetical protein